MTADFHITSHSTDDTQHLAEALGRLFNDRTVLALSGELGSGKTAFVQGLAKGLDIPDGYYITSPTFTLINEYPGRLKLFHIDLYRLEGTVDIEEIGIEDIFKDKSVVAVEWAERLPDDFLPEYILVKFDVAGEESRNISMTPYGRRAENLIQLLKKSYNH